MEKNKARIYWFYAAAYYSFVLTGFCLGWFGISMTLIFLTIPLFIVSFFRSSKYRALGRYMEENHPEAWGRIAARSIRGGIGRGFEVDKFTFSGELDEDTDLRAMKKEYKHLSLFSYCFGAIPAIFVLITPFLR